MWICPVLVFTLLIYYVGNMRLIYSNIVYVTRSRTLEKYVYYTVNILDARHATLIKTNWSKVKYSNMFCCSNFVSFPYYIGRKSLLLHHTEKTSIKNIQSVFLLFILNVLYVIYNQLQRHILLIYYVERKLLQIFFAYPLKKICIPVRSIELNCCEFQYYFFI